MVRNAAEAAQGRFALLCTESLKKYEERQNGGQREIEGLTEELDRIQKTLEAYFSGGFNAGNKEIWLRNICENIAKEASIAPAMTQEVNKMRVQIAESFSSLDSLYKLRIDDIRGDFVAAFNDERVLNGLLGGQNAENPLKSLVDYIDNAEFSIPKMRAAIDTLLNLTIEHNTQFYPRAYAPIESLKEAVGNSIELKGQNIQEKAESLYYFLNDLGTKATSDISNLLITETKVVFNIIKVAFEFFEDTLVRNEDAKDEWIRFFKAYYDDVRPGERKVNTSFLLNKALKQIDLLKEAAA